MKHTAFEYQVDPSTDGHDHIRIHPKATTALGRLLCNGARSRFTHPKYGEFASLEGYWQWVRTGMCHDGLRTVYGDSAVSQGMRHDMVSHCQFRKLITEGLYCKIDQNRKLIDLMILSTSPFLRYSREEHFNDHQLIHACSWFLDTLESIRARLIIEKAPQVTATRYFPFPVDQLLAETMAGVKVSQSRLLTHE